jgi:WD40 repeat protein
MVVIAAVAVTLVLVRNAVSDHPAPAGNHGGPASTQIPRYYIASDLISDAIIGDLRTGQKVATITPPAGHVIEGIAGSANGRVFVLDMPVQQKFGQPVTGQQHEFYMYRSVEAGGPPLQHGPAQTLLPYLHGEEVLGLALSPDGSRLAVLSVPAANYEEVLRVYSVATGKVERQWTMPTGGYTGGTDNGYALTWTSNGHELAFRHDVSRSATATGVSVYILDVTRPGKSLRADSRIVTLPVTGSQCVNMLFTPDGKTVICGNESMGDPGERCSRIVPPEIAEYSAVSGKLTRVLYKHQGRCLTGIVNVYWSNASGSTVVADIQVFLSPSKPGAQNIVNLKGQFDASGRTGLPLIVPGDTDTQLDFFSLIAF